MQRADWWKPVEAGTAGKSWSRFVALFAAVFFGGSGLLVLLILGVDPYDSGRLPSFGIVGIVDDNPRTASVSRGRDARFDAAIIGNSHGQLLSPARLDPATGLHFVQLTVPGTGPREQLVVLHWFASHHARIGAIVLVADSGWCTQDATLPMSNPFPFWLYADGLGEYLAHAFSTRALDLGYRRIMLALGMRRPSDPVGYWDYEAGRAWTFKSGNSRRDCSARRRCPVAGLNSRRLSEAFQASRKLAACGASDRRTATGVLHRASA